jgi:hypothetical protein
LEILRGQKVWKHHARTVRTENCIATALVKNI